MYGKQNNNNLLLLQLEKPLQKHGGRLEHNETYCGSCFGAETVSLWNGFILSFHVYSDVQCCILCCTSVLMYILKCSTQWCWQLKKHQAHWKTITSEEWSNVFLKVRIIVAEFWLNSLTHSHLVLHIILLGQWWLKKTAVQYDIDHSVSWAYICGFSLSTMSGEQVFNL